jgi:hypothetical protein
VAKHQKHQQHDRHYSQQRDDHLHLAHHCKGHQNASVYITSKRKHLSWQRVLTGNSSCGHETRNTSTFPYAEQILWRRLLLIYSLWPRLWPSGQSSWLQKGDVLCFLWDTNWICMCYVEESRPRLWSSGQSSWLQNGDVLCFLWGTNWICMCYVEESSGLVVRVPGYRFRYLGSIHGATRFSEKQWVWNAVHSASWIQLRSYLEEIVTAPIQETEITVVGINRADNFTLSIRIKLVLTSPTSGGRSVGIVRSRAQATEFLCLLKQGTILLCYSPFLHSHSNF